MTGNPVKSDGLVLTDVGDESIVYDPREGKVHVLNGTGAFIWRKLDVSQSLEEISRLLSENFETELQTALKDTREFIEDLKKIGLVH